MQRSWVTRPCFVGIRRTGVSATSSNAASHAHFDATPGGHGFNYVCDEHIVQSRMGLSVVPAYMYIRDSALSCSRLSSTGEAVNPVDAFTN